MRLVLVGSTNQITAQNIKSDRSKKLTQGRNGVFQNIHQWMIQCANLESGTVSRNGISFWKFR
ncbi:MAG: hypothetical protein V7L31_24315 [Nostoc sp.]|uniref:hypothetical protein n=1 Tax=Nostoc sp. TaxID=1180 RepID=UPI002FF32C0D